jgi:DHA1 family solute carrier family 18 vesicular amine transporter 1/2
MCLVAEQFPDDVVRSKIMGIVLGSMALGVLVGYPFGSLMYDFVGKMAPFFIISVAVFLNGGMSFIISIVTC